MKKLWDRIKASSFGYRLAHGTFWSMMGAGASQSLMLLTSIISARILGKQQFGEFGIINNTIGMFSVFAGFALGMTATKYVAEFRTKDPVKAGRIVALSSLVAIGTGAAVALILLAIAPWLASETLAAPQLAVLLRISAGFLFFGALSGAQTGALAGFEAFRIIARINIATGLVSFPLIVGGVYLFGLLGGVSAMVVSSAANCGMNTFALRAVALRAGVPIRYSGCGREKKVLLGFSMPAVLAGIMFNPVNWACAAMLVNQPNGYADMGIFSAANSWQKAILFLPGCLNAIALPMLSDFYGSGRSGEYKKALWYNIALNGGSAFVVALAIALVAGPIMHSYGSGFGRRQIRTDNPVFFRRADLGQFRCRLGNCQRRPHLVRLPVQSALGDSSPEHRLFPDPALWGTRACPGNAFFLHAAFGLADSLCAKIFSDQGLT